MDYAKWSKLDRELDEEEKAEEHARIEHEARQQQAQAPSIDPFGDRFTQTLAKTAKGQLVDVLREANNPEYPICDFGTRMGIMLQLDNGWGNGLFQDGHEYTIFAPNDMALADFRCENPKIESKQLMCILGFHIVEGKIRSADLRAHMLPEIVTTPSGQVARAKYNVTLANLDDQCHDVEHPTFVLHAIDKVLLPPPDFMPPSVVTENDKTEDSKEDSKKHDVPTDSNEQEGKQPTPAKQQEKQPLAEELAEKRRLQEKLQKQQDEKQAVVQKEVQAFKEAGTACYKVRDFEGALRHYHQALDLDRHNAPLHSNIAAAHLEAKEYSMSAHWCKQGIEMLQLLHRAQQVEQDAQRMQKQVQQVLIPGKSKRSQDKPRQRSLSLPQLDSLAKLHARWGLALQRQASATTASAASATSAASASRVEEVGELLKEAEAHCKASLELVGDTKVLQRLGRVQKAQEVWERRRAQEERLQRRARKEAKEMARQKREEELRAKGREVLQQRESEEKTKRGGVKETEQPAGGGAASTKHETSEQHLQRALRSDEARSLIHEADKAFGDGKLEEAVVLYEQAEAKATGGGEDEAGAGDLIPQYETMLICRAMARSQLGRKREALADCNKSIAYRPSFDALVTKADVLEDMGGGAKQPGGVPTKRMRECVEALLEAHAMDPSATMEAQLHQRLYTTFIKLVYREKAGESAPKGGQEERDGDSQKEIEKEAQKIMAEPEIGALLQGLGSRPLGEVLRELQPVAEDAKGPGKQQKQKLQKQKHANVCAMGSLGKLARLYLWGMLTASGPLDRQREQQQVRQLQQQQVEAAAKEEQRALEGISMEWWGKKDKQQQLAQPQRPPTHSQAVSASGNEANSFAPRKLSASESIRLAQEQEQQQLARQRRQQQQQQSSTVNAAGANVHASTVVPDIGPRYGFSERAARVMEEYKQRNNVLPKADEENGQNFGDEKAWPCFSAANESNGDSSGGSGCGSNGGGGGSSVLEMVGWSQSVRDVTVRLRLRATTVGLAVGTTIGAAARIQLRKSIGCAILPVAITVTGPQLQQQLHLFDEVKSSDSTWFLEEEGSPPQGDRGQLLQVHLEKGQQEYWPCPFDGAPCVDITDCQLRETHLDDLADGSPLLRAVGRA
jgi:tetratricopeptide (TPR) repeat protein